MAVLRRISALAATALLSALPDTTTAQLNDTGQTACAGTAGDAIACDDPVAHPGQDGRHGRDAQAGAGELLKTGDGAAGFDFSALDGSGAVTTPGDHACVRDHVTGLVWSTESLEPRTWANAAEAASGYSRCGVTAWRVPTRRELQSLVHHGAASPTIDGVYFPDTDSAPYWTADVYAADGVQAWSVDFSDGGTPTTTRSTALPVRLVATDANHAPRITLGDDIVLSNRDQPQPIVLPGWAKDITPGPASEAAQQLTATLRLLPVDDQKALEFDAPPTLDVATGTLRFTVKNMQYPSRVQWDDHQNHWTSSAGLARVEVTLRDDGGTQAGGVDSTVGIFTIFLDPAPAAVDVSIKSTWRSLCVPVTIGAYDVDTDPTVYTEPFPSLYINTLPHSGFLTQFITRSDAAMAKNDPVVTHAKGAPHGEPLTNVTYAAPRLGFGYYGALCYIPFVSTFTGLDSFTYVAVDKDGNVSNNVGTVNIEIVEN